MATLADGEDVLCGELGVTLLSGNTCELGLGGLEGAEAGVQLSYALLIADDDAPPEANSWRLDRPLPAAREGVDPAPFEGPVVVVGGNHVAAAGFSRGSEIFSPGRTNGVSRCSVGQGRDGLFFP